MEESFICEEENKFWGDTLEARGSNFRVVYNNVNGLQIGDFIITKQKQQTEKRKIKMLTSTKDTTKVTGVLNAIQRWDANVLCLAETQTAWEKYKVRNKFVAEIRKKDSYANMVGSSSSIGVCESYKPGGTATIFDGNWSSRVTKGWDAHGLGRWSYITIRGRCNTNLTIITAYRVCAKQTNRSVGMHSTFTQQETMLLQRGISKTPQECFIVDMKNFVEELIQKGHELLMCLDANEEWDLVGSRIKELSTQTGLYDLAYHRHGGPVSATYVRMNSTSRIDYILGSERVMEQMVRFGIAPKSFDPILGDHRPQFIDININKLLFLNVKDVGSPTSRKLKSGDPKAVTKYLVEVKKGFNAHNVFNRIDELWDKVRSKAAMTRDDMNKYDAIDRDVYRLCCHAENGLRAYRHNKFVWSPDLDLAVRRVKHWKLRKKYIMNESKTKKILRIGAEKGIMDDGSKSMEVIMTELLDAIETLKEIQSKDKEKRIEYLNRLADKYALDNRMDKEAAVRELLDHEEIRELFREIRLKLKGTAPPQLSEVWLQDDNRGKIILNNEAEVEEHLLQRNWRCLRQAANTPFADGVLGDLLHYDGSGELADKIIKGIEDPRIQGMEPTIRRYIKGMKVQDTDILNTVETNITHEEYREFWSKKRETTVTSPFGLHCGHYKSALYHMLQIF